MNAKKKYKQLPIAENHSFACGHKNPWGLRMEFFTDEISVYSTVNIPDHLCGWGNRVHGGILSVILDEVMSWAAYYLLKRIVLTKKITVEFMKSVPAGKILTVEGKLAEIRSEREALTEGSLYNSQEERCVTAQGIYALLTPEAAMKLKIVNEKTLAEIAPLLNA